MKLTCLVKTFQTDMTLESTSFHGLIAYGFKAKHHSSNAATNNMKESQARGKNIQCVTTYFKLHGNDSTQCHYMKHEIIANTEQKHSMCHNLFRVLCK